MSYTILKSTVEKLISEVKLNLKLVFPQFSDIFENTPIHLISGRDILTQTNRIASEIGAPQVKELADTVAITLVGKEKFAIAVFFDTFRNIFLNISFFTSSVISYQLLIIVRYMMKFRRIPLKIFTHQ